MRLKTSLNCAADRPIVFAPPDVILGIRFANDEFVLGGAGSMLARIDDDWPTF